MTSHFEVRVSGVASSSVALVVRITAVATAGTLMVACATGPSEGELVARSDDAKTEVVERAGQVTDALVNAYPELAMEVTNYDEVVFGYDCSVIPASTESDGGRRPDRIQWVADRLVYVTPAQPTGPLLDAVVAALEDQCWFVENESKNEISRSIGMREGQISLQLAGSLQHEPTWESVYVSVASECLEAPDDLVLDLPTSW